MVLPLSPSHSPLDLVRRVLKDDHQRRQLVHVPAAAAAAEFSDDDQRSTLAVIVR